MQAKAILIHGNGDATVDGHWFPYIKKGLEELGIEVIAQNFPDPELAREKYWLPFIEKLGADESTILIGHSSGAVASMRYAEQHKILGSVLVAACYTDLRMESERLSGYYDHPWDWEKIKQNQQWILQYHSTDDPWIPIEEARFIHEKLNTNYREYTDQAHFGGGPREKLEFPEMLDAIKQKLGL